MSNTSRYIDVGSRNQEYEISLTIIIVFTVIGAIIGLMGMFSIIFTNPLLGILVFISFSFCGYLIPFLWIGLKQWYSLFKYGCFVGLILIFFFPYAIAILTLFYGIKGIIAILKESHFKHKWKKGCKCLRCGKEREHVWDGCKCTRCGMARDEQHTWEGCKCSRCGKVQDKQHTWEGCKCSRCGKVRDEQHKWHDNNCNNCKCTRCGTVRHHMRNGCKCIHCGREMHEWINCDESCKCDRCGKKEEHKWSDGRCTRCGYDIFRHVRGTVNTMPNINMREVLKDVERRIREGRS